MVDFVVVGRGVGGGGGVVMDIIGCVVTCLAGVAILGWRESRVCCLRVYLLYMVGYKSVYVGAVVRYC